MAPFQSLRDFIMNLEEDGELKRIKVPLSLEEIPALTKKLSEMKGPAVLVEHVKGYDMPFLTSLFGTRKRLAIAFQTPEDALFDTLVARRRNPLPPVEIPRSRAPCKEVVHVGGDIDMTKLPVPLWSEGDGGPMISWPVVHLEDPELRRNIAFYRMQVKGKQRTTLRLESHRQGYIYYKRAEARGQRKMEVAVAVGVDPIVAAAAATPAPLGVDELALAGGFRGEPVEVVQCETVNLKVPAHSEIVIEGYVPIPAELDEDGPYGEFARYQTGVSPAFPFHVTAVTRRRDAIYEGAYEGAASHCDSRVINSVMGEVEAYGFLSSLSGIVKKVHFPSYAMFHMIIQIDSRVRGPGIIRNLLCAAAGSGGMTHIIAVDDDINIYDVEEVQWAISTRVQPARDVEIIPNAQSSGLNPSATKEGLTSKMLIDATKKPDFRGKPIRPLEKGVRLMQTRWAEYQLGL